MIQTTHQAKSRLHAYIVNQPEQVLLLCKAGVDGIFTADPLMARKILAEDYI